MRTERVDQQLEQRSAEQDALVGGPWILFILSLVAIVPFWTVRYPVMADYPNHLARWFVLFHMKDPAYRFPTLYAPAWGLVPYISLDILALALQYLFSIAVVGKCILSFCVVVTALTAYFFLKQACPENTALSSFAILVALNPMFLMGSINYGLSLAFCLLAVGLWVNYCKAPKMWKAVGIVIALILVFLTHLYGFLVAGLVMGIYALFQDQRWKKLGILAVLSLPALLILVRNPIQPGGGPALVYAGLTIWSKLKFLGFPVRIYTSKKLDLIFFAGLASLILLLLKKKPKLALQPVWLAVSAVLLLAYFVAPAQYGLVGGYADVRLLPFVYLFLLAAIQFDRVPRYFYVGLALLVLFRVATVERMFTSQQRELQQLTDSFEAIPRNARVLPIVRLPSTGLMGRADIHHLEEGIIERGFLDPVLFHIQGVQPIRLVGSPYCPDIFCEAAQAPEVDWQQIANSYDYLWVHDDPEVTTFTSQIGDVILSNDLVTIYKVRHTQLHLQTP